MFLVFVIVLLVLYHSRSGSAPIGEVWFMISIFVGLAYVAGFLDSRLFARFDKNKGNMLHDLEERYQDNVENTPTSSQPLNS